MWNDMQAEDGMDENLRGIAAKAVRNSIWETLPVAEQPSITLIRWSVREIHSGERHFVGYNPANHEGRVSTAILSFDPRTGHGVTCSGRIYHLVGPSGRDRDGEWVWTHWVHAQKCSTWSDVSPEFENLIAEHRKEAIPEKGGD